MDTTTSPLTSPQAATPTPVAPLDQPARWEIAEQWRLAWRSLKWAAFGAVGFFGLMAAGQIYLFHQMFSDIHPAAGGAFVAIVLGLAIWLIGAPLYRFFQAPTIAQPPAVDLKQADLPPGDIKRRIAYDDTYLRGIANNPALVSRRGAAIAARRDLEALKNAQADGLAQRLAAFERERIATLLVDLDKQVDDYIHKEALAVGSATAVSLNGSVDAFVVLWRNINMVSRISRLYYGRPSLRLSLTILRDVMVAVLLSRALDDVSDAAGEALGGVMTRLGGMVAGPLIDGSVNALVTTKIGYLTKKRCRSFDVWSETRATRATKEVIDQVKRESSALVGELVKMTSGFFGAAGDIVGAAATKASDVAGAAASAAETVAGAAATAAATAAGGVVGAASDAAEKVLAAPKSAWSIVQDTFVKKPASQNAPGGDASVPGGSRRGGAS
ncbi:MAG: DUF697 domain-containing protein [Pseudomonadota bacterium]